MTSRFPFLSALGTLLALLAIARIAALVLNSPMLAFANQYDMVRTGACIGLYPDLPAERRDAATPEAPREAYRLGLRERTACYPGTEALLAGVVVAKHRLLGDTGAAFPALRELGILKLGLSALAIAALAASFWRFPGASLLHGATALVVLADPVVSLWYQTLYAEFPIFLGLYLLVGALVAGLLREALSAWHAALAGAGIVLAAFAKEQFFLLPIAILAVAVPRLWVTSRRALLALAALALSALAWHALVPRSDSIAQANRADTYLGLVLPASANPKATLAALGLPERCGEVSGATWYLPRGEDLRQACPEVFALPSTAFLRLAVPEPATLARALARAVPTTQNPLLGNLGMVAGKAWGTIDGELVWVRSALQPAAAALPGAWYTGAVLLALAGLLPALALWAGTLVRGANAEAHPFGAYVLMLVLVVGYSLATTVFGDGLSESARHNLPGFLALAALAPAALAALAWMRQVGTGLRAVVAVASLVAFALALAAIAWASRQPLAIGVVEAPSALQVPGEGFVLKGWALDPSGIAAIRVHGAGQVQRIGREQLLARRDLAGIFPGYPDAVFSGFEVGIPGAWLSAPEVRLRVEVENRSGVVTEIDRRRVRPAR